MAVLGAELPQRWPEKGTVMVIPDSIGNLSGRSRVPTKSAMQMYSCYRSNPRYAETHSMLMLMMSRVDSTGTFRALEREVLIRKLHLEIFSVITESQPSLAIFDVTPHEAMDFALMKALEWRGVPQLMFQPSLVGPQVMARTSLTKILRVKLDPHVVARHKSTIDIIYKIAESSIDRLALGSGTPKMDNQKAKEDSLGSVGSRVRAVGYSLKRLREPGRDAIFALTGHQEIPQFVRRILELFLERSLRSSLRGRVEALPSLSSVPKERFALFALHYEPERSSIPEGYPFDSQLDAIIAARNLLPDAVTLLVKEHFSQKAAALRGFVGRSIEFYSLLQEIPGVTILGTNSNTRDLIRSAECVMTFTGKVGIEAVLETTRVIFLGQPWWDAMPGTVHFDDLTNYDQFLSRPLPSVREVRDWISGEIRSSLLPGVSSVSPERHAERITPLPPGFQELEAEGIVAAVDAVISQYGKQRALWE